MDKVIGFIDGSNLYFGCKQQGRIPPWDVVSLCRDIAGKDRKLVRVYYYNARSIKDEVSEEQYAGEEKFYNFLRNLDYLTVRLGRLEGRGNFKHQKGVDTLLVMDMLTLTFENAMDCAVLVANDGDYASVINEVKTRGKQVEVGFPGDTPAFHLRDVCDKYINLMEVYPNHFVVPGGDRY